MNKPSELSRHDVNESLKKILWLKDKIINYRIIDIQKKKHFYKTIIQLGRQTD